MNALDPIAWAFLLMLLGCALMVLEVFIPSAGILGFLSATSFLAAIYFAFQRGSGTGLSFSLGLMVVVPVVLSFAFKYLPYTPIGKALLGTLPTDEEVLTSDPRKALVGRVGIARSKMLPSGAVEIDGQMIDAVTQGLPIDPGQYVEVIEVRGNRVVVRPAAEGQRPQQADPRDVLSQPLDELGIEGFDEPLA
ncbi:MAG: NfeD family protein [Pirellulales bacterium]